MAAKETLALVGITHGSNTDLVNKLAQGNYRLLLVSNDTHTLERLSGQIIQEVPDADIETIDCVKNGCWEADIILLAGTAGFEEELLERIRIFATQKIVVGLSVARGKVATFEAKNIQHLLPDSQVVHLVITPASEEVFIAGDNSEAVQTIRDIVARVGYHPVTVDSLQASQNYWK